MLRMVARLRAMASLTAPRESPMRTMSADSMAISVPAPMAIPTSAVTSAGASLMPSPTISTRRPCSCKVCTAPALSVGSTSEIT